MSIINNYDLAAIHNFVSDDWIKNDGSKVLFEIHKLSKQRFLFFNKVKWIIQLYSCSAGENKYIKKGCTVGNRLVSALHYAGVEVKYDFSSLLTFEFASDGF